MRTQKGITMASLVTTIIVLVILASVATYSGIQAYSDARLQAFINKMKVIQKRVDLISQEYLTWNDEGTYADESLRFEQYLKTYYGFSKITDSSFNSDSHATNLKTVISSINYKGIAYGEYYYFTPETIKTKLGIETLTEDGFYIAVFFSNPKTDINGNSKMNRVYEEEGFTLKTGDTSTTYHEYYSIK